MNSIRVRLLLALLAALVLSAAVMGAVTYRNVLAETETLFDYQLRQMALSLRDQGEIAPGQISAFADGELDFVVQIWTVDGRSIYASRPHTDLPARALLGLADVAVGGRTWRTFSVATRERVIQVAQPRQIRQRLAADAALRSVLPLLLLAPLMALAIWWLAALTLAPLRRVAAQVRERDEQSLAALPTTGLPDEVAPLVSALNALLQRLGQSLDTQRAFVSEAAHELRSPLTALKLQLQLLNRATDDAGRAQAVATLSTGIDRAARLVEQLLALARSEPGAPAAPMQPLDLSELVRQAVADTVPFAQSRGTEFELFVGDDPQADEICRPPPGATSGPLVGHGDEKAPGGPALSRAPVTITGDRNALGMLARNLADNAVRYSLPGSRVEVRVEVLDGVPTLQVDDAGPGIPPADRERVFDRFYRRNAGGEQGTGLGLAIVRSVAARHGAEVALGDSPLGGLKVTVRFARLNPGLTMV